METETNKMKRQCCKNHNTAKPVVMEDLPQPILVQILSTLPSKSIFRLGCVSKPLLSTIDDHSLIKLQNRLLADNVAPAEVPQLMSIGHKADSDVLSLQTIKCVRSALRRGKYKLNLSSQRLCFVFRNLFCFQLHGEEHCCIVNPLRRSDVLRLPTGSNIQQLPEASHSRLLRYCFYGMGVDKNTNDRELKIVRVGTLGCLTTQKLVVHVLELGAASWREIPSVPPDDFRFYKLGVSACNDMHWLTQIEGRSRVLCFDFTKEEFSWTPMPLSLDLRSKIHLLTFRGSLILTATISSVNESSIDSIEIWMLKDYERKVWMLEYVVDVETFCGFRVLEVATCGEWEHGIYFCYHRASGMLRKSFLDLRHTPVKLFSPPLGRVFTYIVSYTGSLLSLQNYGNLVDANELVSD